MSETTENADTPEQTLVVHKFELAFGGPTMLPVGARIVDVGWEPLTEAALDPSAKELRLIVWALVDPTQTQTEERYLLIAGTGVAIHPQSAGRYIGRIELYEWPRRVQLHVFEAVPAPAEHGNIGGDWEYVSDAWLASDFDKITRDRSAAVKAGGKLLRRRAEYLSPIGVIPAGPWEPDPTAPPEISRRAVDPKEEADLRTELHNLLAKHGIDSKNVLAEGWDAGGYVVRDWENPGAPSAAKKWPESFTGADFEELTRIARLLAALRIRQQWAAKR